MPLLVGEQFELQAAQDLDLGDVVLAPPAALRVELRGLPGTVTRPVGELDEGYHRLPLPWDGTHLATDDATAGRHRIRLTSGACFAPPRDVELVTGRVTALTIDVVPACWRRIRVALPLPDRWERSAS